MDAGGRNGTGRLMALVPCRQDMANTGHVRRGESSSLLAAQTAHSGARQELVCHCLSTKGEGLGPAAGSSGASVHPAPWPVSWTI